MKYEVVVSGIVDEDLANSLKGYLESGGIPDSMTISVREVPDGDDEPSNPETLRT